MAVHCAIGGSGSHALVLMLYGMGGAPDWNRHLLTSLRTACDNGAIIAVCSQCLSGAIELDKCVPRIKHVVHRIV